MSGVTEEKDKDKKAEGYELSEEQLIEILNFIEEKRKYLLKHPESPDHIALWKLEEHVLKRLNEIAWKKYQKEKGISVLKV